jgi:flagellar biosynthesis protein FlhB
MADAQDRNLPASERKLRKARQDGQVARSRDFGHFVALGLGAALLTVLAPQALGWTRHLLDGGLRFDAQLLARPQSMIERLAELSWMAMWVVVPMGALFALAAVAAAVAGGGWNFTLKPLHPNFGKLNPLSGLGRMVSRQQLGDTLKACALALVLGVVGALYLKAKLPLFHDALALPLPAALAHAGGALMGGLLLLVLALAAFAVVDLPLQRFLHAQRLRMSHDERKQEYKELEGNQEVKNKIKVRMREMARKRMLAAVPQADLVVMNPTHFAVALKYDEAKMGAPRVVAKGADLLALRIRDIAKEARVPVLQSPPLARALYAHTEVDQEVPAALFAAVAQVLAYVYQLRAALAGQGAMPAELPEVVVPPELDPLNGKPVPAGAAE